MIDWLVVADVVGLICIVTGAVFTLIAAIGMVRYPDLLSRQHVATKPQVFSLIMYFIGIALLVRNTAMSWTLLLVCLFQLLSAPISAHMMSRAAYRTGRLDTDSYVVDELGEDLRREDDRI